VPDLVASVVVVPVAALLAVILDWAVVVLAIWNSASCLQPTGRTLVVMTDGGVVRRPTGRSFGDGGEVPSVRFVQQKCRKYTNLIRSLSQSLSLSVSYDLKWLMVSVSIRSCSMPTRHFQLN